ncbi:hypothetical protein Y032_0008g26 [Ancylostoma ceylanicum]|uniref:Uncharacterized protein n=1 Tax=Ancylostoma ceylanicum TaxID=53326 RepID=A0A016VLN9_9BILA|nr:hypothetical protein Y032_0008g26 [Ancylostoma ceylanicum]
MELLHTLVTPSSLAEPSTNTTHVSALYSRESTTTDSVSVWRNEPSCRLTAEGRLLVLEAIHKMTHPKDVSQLRAFLGLDFYGTFLKDLRNFCAPLDAPTKKDVVYTWTPC